MSIKVNNLHRKSHSLLNILNSCKSADELFNSVRNILINEECGVERLPSWLPDASGAVLKWTQKIIELEHIPSACCLVKLLSLYAATGSSQDVDSDMLLTVYLQMNSFAVRIELQGDPYYLELWHDLTGLFYSLTEYHQDTVLRNFCLVGRSLLTLVVNSNKPRSVRGKCLKDLNELMKLSPNVARGAFRKNCNDLFIHLPNLLEELGDYDLQVTVVEAIYRMTPSHERSRCVTQWFPNLECPLQSLFIMITEFDPDCRRFLNAFNSALGQKRQVYTFPCNSAAIGQMRLNKPQDPSYQKFWVDFNLGSETILLLCQKPYNADAGSSSIDHPWESLVLDKQDIRTVTLTRTVQVYSLEVVLKNSDTVADLFASQLSQESRSLMADTFLFEFAPLEMLEKVCTYIFDEKFHIVALEPEGWINIASRNASGQTGEGMRSSGSGRRYRKCSMNLVHCKASSTSTSEPKSEICIAKKRKFEHAGTTCNAQMPSSQSSSVSCAKKHRKSSITYLSVSGKIKEEIALKKLPELECIGQNLPIHFTKTSECSINLDSDETIPHCQVKAISDSTKLTGGMKKPVVKNFPVTHAVFSTMKQLEESPNINTTSQDARLLNLAMDTIEDNIEHKGYENISSLTNKMLFKPIETNPSEEEVIPCSLNSQERIKCLSVSVTPLCKKKLSPKLLIKSESKKLSKSSESLFHAKYESGGDKQIHEVLTDAQQMKSNTSQCIKKQLPACRKNSQNSQSTTVQPTFVPISKLKKSETFHTITKSASPEFGSESKKNKAKHISSPQHTKVYPLRNRMKSLNISEVVQLSPKHKTKANKKSIKSSVKADAKKRGNPSKCRNSASPKAKFISVKTHTPLKFVSEMCANTTVRSKNSKVEMLITSPVGEKAAQFDASNNIISEHDPSRINSPKLNTSQIQTPQFAFHENDAMQSDNVTSVCTPLIDSHKVVITSRNDSICTDSPRTITVHPATPRDRTIYSSTPNVNMVHPTTPVANTVHHTTPLANSVHSTTPVANTLHHTTPLVNTVHHTTPLANTVHNTTPVANTLHHTTPLASSVHYTIPVANSVHHRTPVASTVHHTTPVANSMHHTTPVASYVHHTTPVASSVHHTTPVTSSVHHTTPVTSSVHHTTPVACTVHPTTPMASTVHPTTPMASTVHPTTPVTNTVHPTTPVTSTVHLGSPVASSVHLATPVTSAVLCTTPVTSTVHPTTPVARIVHPTTPMVNSVHHRTPVASTVHHKTPLASTVHHTTPVASSMHHTTPVASYVHHTTLVARSVHHTTRVASSVHHTTPVACTVHPTTPVVSTVHPTSPVTSTVHPTTPVTSTVHLGSPMASTVHLATPVASNVHCTTPVTSTVHPTTPVARTVHPTTPMASTVHHTTTVASTVHHTTPVASTVHPKTPVASTVHPKTPVASTVHTATPKNNALQYILPQPNIIYNTTPKTCSHTTMADALHLYPPEVHSQQHTTLEDDTSWLTTPVTKVLTPVAHNKNQSVDAQELSSPIPKAKILQHASPKTVAPWPDSHKPDISETDTEQHDTAKPDSPQCYNTRLSKRPGTPWPKTKGCNTPRPETAWHGTHWPKIIDLDASLPSSGKMDSLISETLTKTIINASNPTSLPSVPCLPLSPRSSTSLPVSPKSTPSRVNSPFYDNLKSTSFIPTTPESISVSVQGFPQSVTESSLLNNKSHKQSLQYSSSLYIPQHIEKLGIESEQPSNKTMLLNEINLLDTLEKVGDLEQVELDITKNQGTGGKVTGISPIHQLERSHLSVTGNKKSPSKALMSTLMILADYPVKSTGLKTPSKSGFKSKAREEKKARSKSYPPFQNRNRRHPSTLGISEDTGVRNWKSKKKLFDTTALTMLKASPPKNTSHEFNTFDEEGSESLPMPSVQKFKDGTDSSEKNKGTNISLPNDTTTSPDMNKSSRKYFSKQRRPSVLSQTLSKKKKYFKTIKSVEERKFTKTISESQNFNKTKASPKIGKAKGSSRMSTAYGFFEHPEINEIETHPHDIYSDLDSSGKESEHSWLYRQKQRVRFEGSTYSNRKSSSGTHRSEMSSDGWQPFRESKKSQVKVKRQHIILGRETRVNTASKRQRKPRTCEKNNSYAERSTDIDTDHNPLSTVNQNTELATSGEGSYIQNKSADILRHTSKSSLESNTPSMMDFSLIPAKGKDIDDRYKRVRDDISEYFGFSSPEVNEPYTKRVRKSVEEMGIRTFVENILPQQLEIPSKLKPVVNLGIVNVLNVPGPPNNTPVSVEADVSTQTFDTREISKAFKDKHYNQCSPSGPLQSTLIEEYDDLPLVSTARFSYVSEADTSYVEHVADQNNSVIDTQNVNANELKETFGTPDHKTGISSELKFDDLSVEEDIQEPFDMIPQRSWMSSSDEGSSSLGRNLPQIKPLENEEGCHLKYSSHESQVTLSATTKLLISNESFNSQDLFSQDKLVSPPMPSLQNYSKSSQDNDYAASTQTSDALNSLLNKLTNTVFAEPVSTYQQTPNNAKKDQTPARPEPRTLFSTSKGTQAGDKEGTKETEKNPQSGQNDIIDSLQHIRTCMEHLAESIYRLSSVIGNSFGLPQLKLINQKK